MGNLCFKGSTGGDEKGKEEESSTSGRVPERGSVLGRNPQSNSSSSRLTGGPMAFSGSARSTTTPPNSAIFSASQASVNGTGSWRELERNGMADGGRLRRFTMAELAAATDQFSEKAIVSEGGTQSPNFTEQSAHLFVLPPSPVCDGAGLSSHCREKAIVSEGGTQSPNVVYRGRLRDSSQQVAIKRFFKAEREDWDELLAEAHRVASLEHPNITRLIGYCREGHGALVSEYKPNATLAQHLFYWTEAPMQWPPRMEVAIKVAQALEYLTSIPGIPVYADLNPYRVLFDEGMRPMLSCFGLLTQKGKFSLHLPPETDAITPSTVVYMLGSLLLSLFSGRNMNPRQFVERRYSREDVASFLDSELRGKPGAEQAMQLVPAIVECLQEKPKNRPPLQQLAGFLAWLHADVDPEAATDLSEFKAAAVSGHLEKLHELLSSDHLFPTSEFSFDLWNTGLRGALRLRQQGEAAFRQQNWRTAVVHFDKSAEAGVPPNLPVHLRRCFAYMRLGQWEDALQDADKALVMSSELMSSELEAKCLKAMVQRELGDATAAQRIFDSVA